MQTRDRLRKRRAALMQFDVLDGINRHVQPDEFKREVDRLCRYDRSWLSLAAQSSVKSSSKS